jgi:hypothetical protein
LISVKLPKTPPDQTVAAGDLTGCLANSVVDLCSQFRRRSIAASRSSRIESNSITLTPQSWMMSSLRQRRGP